jgi:hypothetical protein
VHHLEGDIKKLPPLTVSQLLPPLTVTTLGGVETAAAAAAAVKAEKLMGCNKYEAAIQFTRQDVVNTW